MKILAEVIKINNATLDDCWDKTILVTYLMFGNQPGWMQTTSLVNAYLLHSDACTVRLLHTAEERQIILMLHPELEGQVV